MHQNIQNYIYDHFNLSRKWHFVSISVTESVVQQFDTAYHETGKVKVHC